MKTMFKTQSDVI